MDSLSTYFPGFIKKFADTLSNSKSSNDTIKFIRFQKIPLRDSRPTLCILLGYELGFELWALLSEPELLFSKRNQGISLISYIPSHPGLTLALSSLYHTSDFPQNSFQIFSVTENRVLKQIETEQSVSDLQSNSSVLVVGMVNKLVVYETKTFGLINCICVSFHDVRFSLSNLYIAYVLPKSQEAEEVDIRIADVISKTVQSFAEKGFTKIKGYMEGRNKYAGKIWVKNLAGGGVVCEIQAFNVPISIIKFSQSSHLLVAAVENGTSFHVYRINPPKDLKGEYKSRYFLLYKLHRGVTPADIYDISISDDDHFVTVTSSRGTCHIYKINPYSDSLIYNQEVFTRIKLGSLLDPTVLARCWVQKSSKPLNSSLSRVQDSDQYEIQTISFSGTHLKYSMSPTPVQSAHQCLVRSKDFREVKFSQPLLPCAKNVQSSVFRIEMTQPGWTPLATSSQFSFFSTDERYEETLTGDMRLENFLEEKSVPSFTVHYENCNGLQDALNGSIPERQVVRTELDCQFIEKTVPTYHAYLAEHFLK